MRLVQRIGRLYRYGQGKRVVVFNVHAPQTLDAEIMEIMYTRITQVASDMAVLGDEYNENLAEDILGELADMLEVEEIIEGCRSDIDSSCGTFAWKRHHVAGDDDLLTIGLGEQRPRLVEA